LIFLEAAEEIHGVVVRSSLPVSFLFVQARSPVSRNISIHVIEALRICYLHAILVSVSGSLVS